MRFSDDDGHLYDVVAISLEDNSILWVDRKKTLPNAEAIVAMAVMRQGVRIASSALLRMGFIPKASNGKGRLRMGCDSRVKV